MNKKVYVLMGGYIDDRHVVGVFSSRKKCDAARQWLIDNDKYYKSYPDDLDVEIFHLNGENINAW